MKKYKAVWFAMALLMMLTSCFRGLPHRAEPQEPASATEKEEAAQAETESGSEKASEDTDTASSLLYVPKLGIICPEGAKFGETELDLNCSYYGIDRAGVEDWEVRTVPYESGLSEQESAAVTLFAAGCDTIVFDVFSFLHHPLLPLIRINAEIIESNHEGIRVLAPESEEPETEETAPESETIPETEAESTSETDSGTAPEPEKESETTKEPEPESETVPEETSESGTDLSKVWPGREITWNVTDQNGYKLQCTMKYGVWIKASDTENLKAAWRAVGGKGDVPDIKDFNAYHLNDQVFRSDRSVMTFCTFEMKNMTEGYDFTPEFPYKVMLNYISDPQLAVDSNLGSWQGAMYFTNNVSYLHTFSTSILSTTMKSNHWGPVPVVYAIANVFGPNFGEDGNEALDDVYLRAGGFTKEAQDVYLPALWKN